MPLRLVQLLDALGNRVVAAATEGSIGRRVQGVTSRLLTMSVGERRELPFMHPGRADVIGAGALILDRILRRTPVDSMLVSESDILDGIAWSQV